MHVRQKLSFQAIGITCGTEFGGGSWHQAMPPEEFYDEYPPEDYPPEDYPPEEMYPEELPPEEAAISLGTLETSRAVLCGCKLKPKSSKRQHLGGSRATSPRDPSSRNKQSPLRRSAAREPEWQGGSSSC